MSFRTRLVFVICGFVVVTAILIAWPSYESSRSSTTELADRLFREVSQHAVTHAREFVLRAAPIVDSVVRLAGDGLNTDDSDHLARQLLVFLNANPGLSWVSYSDEAGNFTGVTRTAEGGLRANQSRIVDGHTHKLEHDVLADGTWRPALRDDDSGYDPRQRPFYLKAQEQHRVVWMPPYLFYHGTPGITCAEAVLDGQQRVRGVATVDFDLSALSDFIGRLSVSANSRIFLFTLDGMVLAHPALASRAGHPAEPEARLLRLGELADPLVEAFERNMGVVTASRQEASSFRGFEFRHAGTEYFASVTTFRAGDDLTWAVGAIAPASDFLGQVQRSRRAALLYAGAALLLAIIAAIAMARRVSDPVMSVIGFMERVGAGDLDARIEFVGGSEFRRLAISLQKMIADLRDRLRLRHSLNVAMQVQQRLLPRSRPKVPGLDIAGFSHYCDETGGDYYDFLLLEAAGSHSLLIAMGDVMGHGIAAALVMAGARAVLHDRARTAGSIAELLERLNNLLAADHGGTRFMTMHLSVIDMPSQTFRWASAGHDPAIIYDVMNDAFIEIELPSLPLGIVAEARYEERQYGPLRPGQVIVVGTDGVWEMPNETGDQFGKQRLRAVIREFADRPAEEIAQQINARLLEFRGAARTVDDVTFVVVRVLESFGKANDAVVP